MKPNALSATSATTIGLSGMRAAQNRLDTTAHNIANAQTPGFRRQRIEQSALPQAGGVETRTLREEAPQAGELAHLAEDLVAQRMSVYSFSANLKTVQTEDRMLGSVLDQTA